MAIIVPTLVVGNDKYQIAKWETLTADDVGDVADLGKYPEKSVQITGTLGGAVPGLEGSMDKVTWFLLTFDGVNAIAALGMFYVWENPNFIRANNGGGDGTTDVDYQLGMSTLV